MISQEVRPPGPQRPAGPVCWPVLPHEEGRTEGRQTSGENDRQLETEAELCWDLSSHQGQIDQRQEIQDQF